MLKKKMKEIIFILIYIVSCFYAYNWIRIAHSKKGMWNTLDVGVQEFIITFFPIINIGFTLFFIFCSPYKEKKNLNRFFKVKK